jgi:hypothetical protein
MKHKTTSKKGEKAMITNKEEVKKIFLSDWKNAHDARAWLKECFYDQEDEIDELTPSDLFRSINKYYEGGVSVFLEHGN